VLRGPFALRKAGQTQDQGAKSHNLILDVYKNIHLEAVGKVDISHIMLVPWASIYLGGIFPGRCRLRDSKPFRRLKG
jgi:hypothetical protein